MRCQGCEATIEPGASGYVSKWAKIKASEAGWYFQRDGRVFCPEHRPAYAPAREGTTT